MESMQNYLGQELKWIQPAMMNRDYELRTPELGDAVATLRWETMMAVRAEAYTNEGIYYLDRRGAFNRQIQVREQKERDPIATLKPNMNASGTLNFVNGQAYKFDAANFWRTEWHWKSADEGVLMNFRFERRLKEGLKQEVVVLIDPAAADFLETPLLAIVGFYQILLMQQDAAAASV